MKCARGQLAATLAVTGGIALAQAAEDPMAKLRACSLMERAERLECLDRLSRTIAPQPSPTKADNWIVSQTTSPVDYSPIATATTLSRDEPGGSFMKFVVRCRGGRTELVFAEAGNSIRSDDYAISYRINDGQPVQVAATAPALGAGVALTGDVVRFLRSLPEDGQLTVRLAARTGAVRDVTFSLAGIEAVRAKLAAVCNWPHAVAKPNH